MALRKKQPKDNDGDEKPVRPRASKKSKPVEAKSSRGRRFTLIIGDEGAILIFMQGNKVVRRLFAPSPQASHSEAMMEIMRTHPSVPISILADVIDQQYVPQNFPPVSKLSVGGLVKRRLERDFQPEDLKGALQLGRDKGGRKEWKYLLVALAKTPLMSEWIDLLVELPNEMKGIFLVPVEAVNYVNMLAKKRGTELHSWQLLISHNKVSGFRQVVMNNGKLIFTRVSQAIDDAIPAVIAGNVEQEIINTIEYLKRLEFRDSTDLDATIVISQDVIDSLDLKRFNFGHAEALTPLDVAERLGLEQAALSADRFGDVVMAAAFSTTKKRILRFSNAYIDKLAKLYVAQIAVKVFAAIAVLALLGLSAMTVVGMVTDYTGIGDIEYKSQQQKPELTKMQKAVDGLNRDVAFKSAVVATYDVYLKTILTPEEFVKDVAPFATSRQRITDLDWELTDPNFKGSGGPVGAPQGGAPAAAGAAANAAMPLKAKIEVDFSGSGTTLDVVDKSANEMLETMKTKLPQYEIVADPFPWTKEETSHNEEVAVEVNSPSSVVVQNATGTINFRGLKKTIPGVAGAPAAVGSPGVSPTAGGPNGIPARVGAMGRPGMPGGQP